LRFQQQDLVAADPAFAGESPEFLLPRAEPMHLANGVDGHEPDIMAMERILRPRIAEACPDLHGARPASKNAHPASGMGVLVRLA
jgi:hypothetical protein